ncbi:hypothetical protein HMPREF0880_03913 [Yokenella regensburgei ATCC 43003]|jgi:hypothetical protein|nr:hypothetical protein HMPREF0880_03913 [Yokenella regensburgei ATCC 43003]
MCPRGLAYPDSQQNNNNREEDDREKQSVWVILSHAASCLLHDLPHAEKKDQHTDNQKYY